MFKEFLYNLIPALVVDQILQLTFNVHEYERDLRILGNVKVLLYIPGPIFMLAYFCNSILHMPEVIILSTYMVLVIQPFLNIKILDIPRFLLHKLLPHIDILLSILRHTMYTLQIKCILIIPLTIHLHPCIRSVHTPLVRHTIYMTTHPLPAP